MRLISGRDGGERGRQGVRDPAGRLIGGCGAGRAVMETVVSLGGLAHPQDVKQPVLTGSD